MKLDLTASLALLAPVAYPDLTEKDPRRKLKDGGKYILQYGRAHVVNCLQSSSQDFFNGHKSGRYQEALLYAKGRQDAGQYALLLEPDGSQSQRKGKLDKRILQIIPKYRRAVMGLLKDRSYTPEITAVDAIGANEKALFEAMMRTAMNHQQFLQDLGLTSLVSPDAATASADVPVDEDDLQLRLADYRSKKAMDLEESTIEALVKGKYADQDKQCQSDDVTYGSSVIYLAAAGTKRIPRRLDPGKCFFLPSDTGDYDNLQAGAHIESITLGTLLGEMEADPNFKLKEGQLNTLKSLATPYSATGTFYSSTDTSERGMAEAGGTLQVVRFSFLSTDRIVRALGTDKLGNARWVDKPAGYTNPKNHYAQMEQQDVVNVYEGTLVLGTDIGYGARLAHAQLRDPENPFVAHPFYVVTTPDMLGGMSDSIVEQAMPPVDMAMRHWLMLQDLFAGPPTSGLQVNFGVLAQVAMKKRGGNDNTMTEQELMQMFFRNRVIAYNGIAEDGSELPEPIKQFLMDISPIVTMHWNIIQNCRAEVESITGINGAVAAANAQTDIGKGTTELAIQGSQNTLEFLYYAKQNRFERVCRAIVANIKANDPDTATRSMQVSVEQVPTTQEWNDFYAEMAIAIQQKTITAGDTAAIREAETIKRARRLLAAADRRKRLRDQEDAQKNTDYATQQQTAAAQSTEQFKQQTMQLQAQLEEQRDLRQRETQLMTIQAQGELNERLAQITGGQKLQAVALTNHAAATREEFKEDAAHERHAATVQADLHKAELQAETQRNKPAAAK